jgi:hypothetical protein
MGFLENFLGFYKICAGENVQPIFSQLPAVIVGF